MLKKTGIFTAILLTAFTISVQAQTATLKRSEVVEKKLASKLMARDMPYRVVLPTDYDKAKTKRYAVAYLLHGLTGHYDNWTDKTKLAEFAALHDYILVTPEGDNGWYMDSASVPNDKYESYIIKELIPDIDKNYRTISDRSHRAIAGLSMGGYGGIKFGIKYPEIFALVGSFSGALQAASFNEKNAGTIGKGIDAIFGADGSEIRKENDIFGIIKEMTPEKIKELPFIYLDCGTEDFLFKSNREFAGLLFEKKVPHEFRELPGGHNWTYWNSQVKEFLEVADSRLGK